MDRHRWKRHSASGMECAETKLAMGQTSRVGGGAGLSHQLSQALTQSVSPSALEEAAGFGRWWFDPRTSQTVLSALAARYLNVESLHHSGLDSCFIHVVSDDMLGLIAQLPSSAQRTPPIDFRVISPVEGMRWLRMAHLPPDWGAYWAAEMGAGAGLPRLAILDAAGFAELKVHVNMAAPEFTNKNLPDELHTLVGAYGLQPHRLSLELTEGMLMTRPDQVIPVMRALRQLGFGISLDDFGMGHSSLVLLKNLPISSLKIDRSFVRDLPHQRTDRVIVKTIVDLGCQMGLQVIAEGVETAPQLEILRQAGCSLIQGYLMDRPMGLPALVEKYHARN